MASSPGKRSPSVEQEVTAPGLGDSGGNNAAAPAPDVKGPSKTKRRREHKKERIQCQDVLKDPRVLEVRRTLVASCGMWAEMDKVDKEFDEETKRIGLARNVSDTSTQENEEAQEEIVRKKKKKKEDDVKESFSNDVHQKDQDSPNAKSAEATSALLEELDFELRVKESTHVKKLSVVKLTSVLLSNFFRLPIFLVIAKFYCTYGVSFIGLCGLIMAFVGGPMIFLELSMGQFTSLPPNTFFARMTPIARGIGVSMLVVRLFSMLCVHVDIRYLFLFVQHVVLSSGKIDYRCSEAGMPFCHTENMCPEDETPGLYGACIKPDNLKHDIAFKDKMMAKVLEVRALQSSPSTLLVQNELSEHNVYTLFSYLLVFIAAGLPLIDGPELYSKISRIIVAASFCTPFVIFFNLQPNEDFSVWRAGWNGDMDAFSDPFAWIVAFCLMCSMFNVGEGTWMFIGSWLNFRQKDVFRQAPPPADSAPLQPKLRPLCSTLIITIVVQLLLTFFMSFALAAWAANVVHHQHNGYLSHDEVLEILRDRPLQFWLTLPVKVVPDKHDSYMFLAYVLFTTSSLGYVVTTGEYIIVSLIRALPFLVRVPNVQLRGTLLMVLIGGASLFVPISMDLHVFANSQVHYSYLAMILIVTFYEIMVFDYIYGLQRVLVNLKVLFRLTPGALIIYSRATNYLTICYRFIVPQFLLYGYVYATYYLNAHRLSLLNCIVYAVHTAPFIMGLYKAARHSETTHALVTLFRPDSRFGPAAVNDRKEAQLEENKMGSTGMQ